MAGGKSDLNIRAAFMHLAAELVVALGVTMTSGVITLTAAHR